MYIVTRYAVMGLRVQHVVVMGHAGCGGVAAFAEQEVCVTSPYYLFLEGILLLFPQNNPYSRPLSSGTFDLPKINIFTVSLFSNAGDFVGHWVQLLKPAYDSTVESLGILLMNCVPNSEQKLI